VPTRSLYHFKLLIALVEQIGFYLAQECFRPGRLESTYVLDSILDADPSYGTHSAGLASLPDCTEAFLCKIETDLFDQSNQKLEVVRGNGLAHRDSSFPRYSERNFHHQSEYAGSAVQTE